MRAAVIRDWQLRVEDMPVPVPGPGQVLTRVRACGICGSDLHLLLHGEEARRLSDEYENDSSMDPTRAIAFDPTEPMVMGHEYCCEVVELGPGCDNLRVGDLVVGMPAAFDADGIHAVGFSNRYPGGYAEMMLVNELVALPVRNGLSTELAALTEPLAVGIHAVAKSRISGSDSAIVLGLGPVGLACIAAMKLRGISPIIGADFSPARRQLAITMGADVVVDPRETPAIDAWRRADGIRPLVIFEAVGVPGMIHEAMRMAPRDARILVVGACMQHDSIVPMLGISRELNIQFALAYEPAEFRAALDAIADGAVDLSSWLTGRVQVDDIPAAFADLAQPDTHAKILVVPTS